MTAPSRRRLSPEERARRTRGKQEALHGRRLWLVQFQCQREGTLFYYQHTPAVARSLVTRCPLCGSKRVQATGRTFAGLEEGQ